MKPRSPFTESALTEFAHQLGLELCNFGPEDCHGADGNSMRGEKTTDVCRHAFGRCWASISRGEETETSFYIGDCCLPAMFLQKLREYSAFGPNHKQCPNCARAPGIQPGNEEDYRCHLAQRISSSFQARTESDLEGFLEEHGFEGECTRCDGMGIIFADPPPWEQFFRAYQKYVKAARNALRASPSRRKHWSAVARYWHKQALIFV